MKEISDFKEFSHRLKNPFTKQAKGAGTILNDLSDDEAVAAIVEKLQEKHII